MREAAQKFLRRELDGYLQGRGVERKKEVPLLYVENQPYIHYRKGSLAFYALRDYIGEDAMNDALHAFLEKWAVQGPALSDGARPLRRARSRHAGLAQVRADGSLPRDDVLRQQGRQRRRRRKRADGKYAVHLVLDAKKLKGDSLGNMTEVPIGDYVDVGVFGDRVAGQKLGEPAAACRRCTSRSR